MQTLTINNPNTFTLRLNLIAKGMSLADLIGLDDAALIALDQTLARTYVTDPAGMVTNAINNIVDKKAWHKVADIEGGLDFISRVATNGFDIETVSGADSMVVEDILSRIVAKKVEKLADRAHNTGTRLDNRSLYQPQYTLRLYKMVKREEERYRVMYRETLDSLGLLARWAQEQGSTEVASLRILNEVPEDFDSVDPESHWNHFCQALWNKGWLVTGSQSGDSSMAWNYNVPAIKDYFAKAFPVAIDMGAYNHRLGSPLLPGGYFTSTVKFLTPMGLGDAQTVQEATAAALAEIKGETLLFERPMGCDGSGQYNPNHPEMADLVARYGKVVFQLTALDSDGFFAKGILVPREDLPADVSIAIDPLQVKGAFKGKCEEGTSRTVVVGIMKAWSRKSNYPGNFETLQFVEKPKDAAEAQSLKDDLDSLITEAIQELVRKGPDGMLAKLIKGDEQLKLVTKLLAQLRAYGKDIKPMDVPLLKSVIDDGLGKALWVVANGAGFYGDQKVVVIDNTLEPGTCVTDGLKWGTECAVWRYPCVLPQGLVTVRNVKPKPHHMVDGKVVANTIWLHSSAIVLGMQGDDDGDIVGVSTDPRILRLWARAYKVGPFAIENSPQKLKTLSNSPEGREYVARNNRGPVGYTTLAQAKCLAVGDLWGAIAMAVSNQEAVDSAKKAFIWADWCKLSEPGWWIQGEDGTYRPRQGFEGNYQLGSPFPMDDLKGWLKERQGKFGVIRDFKQGIVHEVLAWRWESEGVPSGKKVRPAKWIACSKKCGGAPHRNLVHYVHDKALIEWRKVESQWMGEPSALQNPKLWLREIMALNGVSIQVPGTFEEYLQVRKACGFEEFGKAMKEAMRENEESARLASVDRAFRDLNLTLSTRPVADLVAVWEWENTPVWKDRHGDYHFEEVEGAFEATKPNNAYRAIAFPGSPILPLLGITDAATCAWANDIKEKVATWALGRNNPWVDLGNWFFKDQKHGDVVKSDGNRVELCSCQPCTDLLSAWTLRVFRANKRQEAGEELKALIQSVNGELEGLVVSPEKDSDQSDFCEMQ